MKTSILLLFLPFLGIRALAEEKGIPVAQLNSTTIIGELGVPLHTVHKVECKVADMSWTGIKADNGRLAFQIISVDGKVREGRHYIDIPAPLNERKPQR